MSVGRSGSASAPDAASVELTGPITGSAEKNAATLGTWFGQRRHTTQLSSQAASGSHQSRVSWQGSTGGRIASLAMDPASTITSRALRTRFIEVEG